MRYAWILLMCVMFHAKPFSPSTHILDSTKGKPASGIKVELSYKDKNSVCKTLNAKTTA